MKLALLAGANPRVCEEGPLVRLSAGHWNIVSEGVVDSELSLTDASGSSAKLNGITDLEMHTGGAMRVVFTKRGTEPFISFYATNDLKPATT